MECRACNREKLKKENPDALFMLNAIPHTCNQPERSKREDFAECPWVHLDHAHKDGCTDPETEGECKAKMRCSEHCGNTVRDK